MKIDALGVQAFVAIAEHGGFQRAAASLHLTQTALSRRLMNLEGFLGVRLFERTTRAVELTAIGRDFLPQARRLLTELAAALTEIRESGRALRGDVTLACVPTVGVQFLPQVIRAYAALHPENRIKVLDHASARVAQAVTRREAEFGISISGESAHALDSEILFKDRFVLICRDDHPLAGRKRLSWSALSAYPLIVPGADSSNRPLLGQALPVLAGSAHFEVQRSSTAVGLVAAGVACAVVPRLAMQAGAYANLRMLALTDPVVERSFVLITRRGAHLSPAAQSLADMIRAQAPSRFAHART
ncbi:MAG: LysR family transcriptional regulator [Burkholderiales bacterium]|nr:LysR family transcriptional regulator [Burkholderiales bacterium]